MVPCFPPLPLPEPSIFLLLNSQNAGFVSASISHGSRARQCASHTSRGAPCAGLRQSCAYYFSDVVDCYGFEDPLCCFVLLNAAPKNVKKSFYILFELPSGFNETGS
jgi:hypothetical protein